MTMVLMRMQVSSVGGWLLFVWFDYPCIGIEIWEEGIGEQKATVLCVTVKPVGSFRRENLVMRCENDNEGDER